MNETILILTSCAGMPSRSSDRSRIWYRRLYRRCFHAGLEWVQYRGGAFRIHCLTKRDLLDSAQLVTGLHQFYTCTPLMSSPRRRCAHCDICVARYNVEFDELHKLLSTKNINGVNLSRALKSSDCGAIPRQLYTSR